MTTTCCCPPLICLPLLLSLLSSLPPLPSHPSPLSLPLSCPPPSLCTLLVFQGQRGSQPDSEIETEIGTESGERGVITAGEKTNRGRLEDKNPPDVVIVSTSHPTPMPRFNLPRLVLSRHNLEPKWPTTGCTLPGARVVASIIFPASWAGKTERVVRQTMTCLCLITRGTG